MPNKLNYFRLKDVVGPTQRYIIGKTASFLKSIELDNVPYVKIFSKNYLLEITRVW